MQYIRETISLIWALKCNFPAFWEIKTNLPTKQPTGKPIGMRELRVFFLKFVSWVYLCIIGCKYKCFSIATFSFEKRSNFTLAECQVVSFDFFTYMVKYRVFQIHINIPSSNNNCSMKYSHHCVYWSGLVGFSVCRQDR